VDDVVVPGEEVVGVGELVVVPGEEVFGVGELDTVEVVSLPGVEDVIGAFVVVVVVEVELLETCVVDVGVVLDVVDDAVVLVGVVDVAHAFKALAEHRTGVVGVVGELEVGSGEVAVVVDPPARFLQPPFRRRLCPRRRYPQPSASS